GYDSLSFADLWAPLAVLCKWIEGALISLAALSGNLGIAVILLAIVVRVLNLPVTIWSARKQGEYDKILEQMGPAMRQARLQFKGAEQSERVLALYREYKITPFSGLKGSVGLLVQIPVLLAVFNLTTVSVIFAGEGFLWIGDLAQP